jgi:hypothetical protein
MASLEGSIRAGTMETAWAYMVLSSALSNCVLVR